MAEEDELREEIAATMQQVMDVIGGGTLLIPDEVQRGMDEEINPKLDVDGLKALRDDLQRLLELKGG